MDIRAPHLQPQPQPQPQATDRASLRKAAEGFEEIFLLQFLKTARAGELAPDITGGTGVRQMRDLFDAEVARASAGRTGFGIADAVEAQFAGLTGRAD